VEQVQPQFFVLENVKGLTTLSNGMFRDDIYDRFSKLTPDVESFRKTLTPISTTDSSEKLNEGGNMFKNDLTTSRINQENVEATLKTVYDKVLPLLNVNSSAGYTSLHSQHLNSNSFKLCFSL
jgi:hypothetical protein